MKLLNISRTKSARIEVRRKHPRRPSECAEQGGPSAPSLGSFRFDGLGTGHRLDQIKQKCTPDERAELEAWVSANAAGLEIKALSQAIKKWLTDLEELGNLIGQQQERLSSQERSLLVDALSRLTHLTLEYEPDSASNPSSAASASAVLTNLASMADVGGPFSMTSQDPVAKSSPASGPKESRFEFEASIDYEEPAGEIMGTGEGPIPAIQVTPPAGFGGCIDHGSTVTNPGDLREQTNLEIRSVPGGEQSLAECCPSASEPTKMSSAQPEAQPMHTQGPADIQFVAAKGSASLAMSAVSLSRPSDTKPGSAMPDVSDHESRLGRSLGAAGDTDRDVEADTGFEPSSVELPPSMTNPTSSSLTSLHSMPINAGFENDTHIGTESFAHESKAPAGEMHQLAARLGLNLSGVLPDEPPAGAVGDLTQPTPDEAERGFVCETNDPDAKLDFGGDTSSTAKRPRQPEVPFDSDAPIACEGSALIESTCSPTEPEALDIDLTILEAEAIFELEALIREERQSVPK